MSVDFEEPVESEADLLRQGRYLFLPAGTPFVSTFLNSPIAAQRAVGKQTQEMGKTYFRVKGKVPLYLEEDVIHKRKQMQIVKMYMSYKLL